jgi:MFS transporter, DHA2 family, multidrug resistance protein
MTRVDPRIMIAFGFVGFAIGTWQASFVTVDWDFWELMWPQIFRGVSLMLCMVPINNLALGTMPPHKMKNASGLFNLMRNLGGAIGIAVCGTILNDRTNLHFLRLAEHLNGGNAALLQFLQQATANQTVAHGGDAAHGYAAALKELASLALREAQTQSFADAFLAIALCFVLATMMVPLMRKVAMQAAPVRNAH